MGGREYNRNIFSYETLVHAISGAAVSVKKITNKQVLKNQKAY